MDYIKKFFEDYDYEIDDKDVLNIIQDIRDMGFKVTISIKYAEASKIDTINHRSTLLSAKGENSNKCYQISMSKSIVADAIDELSDLFYELQTVISRLSDVGRIVHAVKIQNSKRYNQVESIDALIKLIVITSEKSETSDLKTLSNSLTKAGYNVSEDIYSKNKIKVNFPEKKLDSWYGLIGSERENYERKRRKFLEENRIEWNKIKSIAKSLKINVRGNILVSSISITLSAKSVNTKIKSV